MILRVYMCNNRQYVVYIVCATTMHETVGKTQLTYMVSATMALKHCLDGPQPNTGSMHLRQCARYTAS